MPRRPTSAAERIAESRPRHQANHWPQRCAAQAAARITGQTNRFGRPETATALVRPAVVALAAGAAAATGTRAARDIPVATAARNHPRASSSWPRGGLVSDRTCQQSWLPIAAAYRSKVEIRTSVAPASSRATADCEVPIRAAISVWDNPDAWRRAVRSASRRVRSADILRSAISRKPGSTGSGSPGCSAISKPPTGSDNLSGLEEPSTPRAIPHMISQK